MKSIKPFTHEEKMLIAKSYTETHEKKYMSEKEKYITGEAKG